MKQFFLTAALAAMPICAQTIDYRTQVLNKPAIDSREYSFTGYTNGSQRISGDLSSPGAKLVTLTPCPKGVSASDSSHSLYISGGSGTAEPILITGGTCLSGGATGSLTFTTANSHTGAWALSSASAGIQEAALAGGVGAAIVIPPAPGPAVLHIYGPVSFSAGQSVDATSAMIERDFSTSGHVFNFTGGTTSGSLRGGVFSVGSGFAAPANSYFVYARGILYFDLSKFQSSGGWGGIFLDGITRGSMSNVAGDSFTGDFIRLGSTANGATGVTITNLTTSGSSTSTAIHAKRGLMNLSNFDIQGSGGQSGSSKGIYFDPDGSDTFDESTVANGIIDSMANCILVNPAATRFLDVSFSGLYLLSGIEMDMPAVSSGIKISNIVSYGGNGGSGTIFFRGGSSISINNVSLMNQALTGASQSIGIGFLGNMSGVTISGLKTGRNVDGSVNGVVSAGLFFAAATYSNVVVSNSELTPGVVGGSQDGITYTPGQVGIPIPAVVSASPLAFPGASFFSVTGTTTVNAVSGLQAGAFGMFVTTGGAVTFTAGPTIGNTVTTSQNVPVSYFFDGTKLWLGGYGGTGGGGGGGSVTSVFGRTGAISASSGDYAFSQLSGSLGAGQLPAFTGDVTAPGGSSTLTLANTGVSPVACGDATHSCSFTADLKGRILTMSNNAVALALGTAAITGNLPTTQLGSGTGANSGTFWRGDGTWATPAGSGNLADPGSNGPIKRTALNTTAPALAADIYALWTGTCSGTTFLRGDGSCQVPSGSGALADPGSNGVMKRTALNVTAIATGSDLPLMVASGGSHSAGAAPDPGASAGTTKFLREDATWQVPPSSGGGLSGLTNTGSVPFVTAPGVLSQDATASGFFWDSSNHKLGLGTNSPEGRFEAITNGFSNFVQSSAYGTGNVGTFQARSSRGTSTSPTATQLNDLMGAYQASGFGTAVFAPSASLTAVATQAQTDTARGTAWLFYTTPNNSTTLTEAMRIDQSGFVGIGGPPAYPLDVIAPNNTNSVFRISASGTGSPFGLLCSTGGCNDFATNVTGDFTLDSFAIAAGVMKMVHTGAVANTLVLNAGQVGVGTATPGATLDVVGGVRGNTLVSNGVPFASLGTPANGTMQYCNNCTQTKPCAAGGSGAMAERLNGAWDCQLSSIMVASGASHAPGLAPDPGASAGTTRFLREDASWVVPPGAGGSGIGACLNIMSYGGDATGVSANDTAFTNAKAALPSTGGCIEFPAGVFNFTNGIKVGNGTHTTISSQNAIGIRGAGRDSTVLKRTATGDCTAALTISAITNASPAVLTVASHGFYDGQLVNISGSAGLTSVNGLNMIVRFISSSTFSLLTLNGAQVNGNGTYTGSGTAASRAPGACSVVTFQGPMINGSIRDLTLDANNIAQDGLDVGHAERTAVQNIYIRGWSEKAVYSTGVASVNSAGVAFGNCGINMEQVAFRSFTGTHASGVWIDGLQSADGTGLDTCSSVFKMMLGEYYGGSGTFGMYFGFTDSILVDLSYAAPGGGTGGFDYYLSQTGNGFFPSSMEIRHAVTFANGFGGAAGTLGGGTSTFFTEYGAESCSGGFGTKCDPGSIANVAGINYNGITTGGSRRFSKAYSVGSGAALHADNMLLPGSTGSSFSRPAVGASRINGEIGGTTSTFSNDEGFMRLSAGAGTTSSMKSYIDISGYSGGVPDMDRNIVIGTSGTERVRVDVNGNAIYAPHPFSSLGAPPNGSFVYCSDCTIASTCAGSGTGAFAKRLNGNWVCN